MHTKRRNQALSVDVEAATPLEAMTFSLDGCRGATLSHVRGGENAVVDRSSRSVKRRSAQDALRYAVARHRRRPDLSPLQLRGRLYLWVSPAV